MMRGMNRWIWIGGGVVLLALVIGVVWWNGRSAAVENQAPTGDIVTVFTGDLASTATASGRVEARQEAGLSLTGQVAEVLVAVGDEVAAGDPLLVLESDDLERAVANAQQTLVIRQAALEDILAPPSAADLASAEASVENAQAALDDLLDGPSPEELASAEADVRSANANIASASTALNVQSAPGSPQEIEAARLAMEDARATAIRAAEQYTTTLVIDNEFISESQKQDLQTSAYANKQATWGNYLAAKETYERALNGGTSSTVAGSQASVSSAVAQRDAAQARLDQLLAGPTAVQIANAEANLANAQSTLDQLISGPTELQLANAEAQLAQAEIALQRAEKQLAEATLQAPFDGVVTGLFVDPGEFAAGVVVQLADRNNLEVILEIDEVDLAEVNIGQVAELTFEAFPEAALTSELVSISPQPTNATSDLVTYEAFLSFEPGDLPVLVGMTANANLVTAEREGVLLVSNRAIRSDRAANQFFVNRVLPDGSLEEIEVTVGLRDGEFTQVTSGLEEGDEVMIGDFSVNTGINFGPPGDDS